MKLYFRIVLAIASTVMPLTGCRHATVEVQPTIPLVTSILSNPQDARYQYLSSLDSRDPHGDIVLIDAPERCILLSEIMMTADCHDNIDGSKVPDYLPDFAGERITSLLDIVYSPYGRFVESGNDGALREIAVKAALAAADTVCCLAAYDHEFRSVKPRAKMFVISSAHVDAYGAFDIDTLMRSTGADIPVVRISDAVKAHFAEKDQEPLTFAYLLDEKADGTAAYQALYGDRCRLMQLDSLSVADSTSTNILCTLLDAYASSGANAQLSAFVYDDDNIPVSRLQDEYRFLTRYPNEDNFRYRRLLSNDFEFVDARKLLSDRCFRIMRERNMFTHNIAFPIASAYITSTEEKDYVLTDFDVTVLPDEVAEVLEANAPKTYGSYVPNQHFTR